MSPPIEVWVFIVVHSSASSGPGLVRISSGMPTLPTSCSALAWRSSSASAGGIPTSSASRSQKWPMRSMCSPVSASRHSTATPRRCRTSIWVCHSSAVRSRTRRSSTTLSRVTARRARLSASWLQAIVPTPADDRARRAPGRRERSTRPASKASCAATRNNPATRTPRARRQGAAKRRPSKRRDQRHQRDQQQERDHRRGAAERERRGGCPDRVRLDLGARPSARRRPTGVACTSRRRRRRGSHDRDPVRGTCRASKRPRTTSENETVRMVPGGPR